MERKAADEFMEVNPGEDIVVVFRGNGSIDIAMAEFPDDETIQEPHPLWRVMIMSVLFSQGDEEVEGMLRRLEELGDQIGTLAELDEAPLGPLN